jgi:alanine dehydrogenase
MRIGVPREIKDHEFRVGLTPAGARALAAAGHEVRVQSAAGERIGLPDQAYRDAGATVVPDAAAAYDRAWALTDNAAERDLLQRRRLEALTAGTR